MVLEDPIEPNASSLLLHATEHYEIVGLDLPASAQLRIDHYTFDLKDTNDEINISIRCSAAKLAEIGMMFLAASQDAYAAMYVVKRQ